MLEMVISGGWVMIPILLCSVVGLAIIAERLWTLRHSRIVPPKLVVQIWQMYKSGQLDERRIESIRLGSPLGRVLASGLANMNHSREVMKEAIEETGRQVVHELERYLNTLGTIASIGPLLGLLGTVFGMIRAFSAVTYGGVGNPKLLAGGVAEALVTTAAGLMVAIPAVIFFRYFQGKVDAMVIRMEEEALKLVEVIHGEREREPESAESGERG